MTLEVQSQDQARFQICSQLQRLHMNEQGLRDLNTRDRLSWRGPATELREALRECLDKLAPDEDVKKQRGFQVEPQAKGPTMQQKVRYVLISRGLSKKIAKATEDAVSGVEDIVSRFIRSTYDRANVSTHTMTTREEVVRLANYVRLSLCDLLEISE